MNEVTDIILIYNRNPSEHGWLTAKFEDANISTNESCMRLLNIMQCNAM